MSVWRPVDRFAEGVRRDQGAVRVTAERERALIGAAHRPVTVVSLRSDLEALGLAPGATVMVHASLSALGYVVGGPEAVVEALIGVIGPTGTLMMPAHSGQYTDPGSWRNPPVPVDWVETMRESMPPFDKAKSPTRMMGAIAEYFRLAPGVRRSNHPTVSAAAIGPNMATLLDGHSLNQGLGRARRRLASTTSTGASSSSVQATPTTLRCMWLNIERFPMTTRCSRSVPR